jgi:phage gp46-like protein
MAYDANLTDNYDFQIDSDGDILTTDFFETAIQMSIFCERRAAESEVQPAQLRRGWIGNESNDDGFENGSKLWLYEQARVTRTVLQEIASVVQNGLQWFVDDGLAISVNVSTKLQNNNIIIEGSVTRPNSTVDFRYYAFWSNTGAA